jgi:glycosyltransferase involved in cell wall biosynthesis
MMYYLTGDTQWLLGFDKAVEGFDLIHAVDPSFGYTLQSIRAKDKGLVKAVVMTNNESIPYLYDEYEKKRLNKKECIEKADAFIAISELAREVLLIEGAKPSKISLIPECVDTKVYKPGKDTKGWRKRLGYSEDDFIVMSSAKMVWEKGWYDILPAAAYVKQRESNIKFLCVGKGPEFDRIKQFAARENLLDVVKFLGWIDYKYLHEVYRISDLFLYPSLPTRNWNAQFGRIVIYEMATGVPIVGTICGGVSDYVVGEGGGIFVQPQDFSGLGKAIIKLYKDKKLYNKMAIRNRKVAVERYDVDVVSDQIRMVWEKALGIGRS